MVWYNTIPCIAIQCNVYTLQYDKIRYKVTQHHTFAKYVYIRTDHRPNRSLTLTIYINIEFNTFGLVENLGRFAARVANVALPFSKSIITFGEKGSATIASLTPTRPWSYDISVWFEDLIIWFLVI